MAKFVLYPHADAPPRGVTAVSVQLDRVNGRPTEYRVEYCVAHDGSLLLPPRLKPARADDLWQRTCCEVFVMPEGTDNYIEFNLSPSSRWAAYGFHNRRDGRCNVDLAFEPEIEITPETPGWFWLAAELDVSSLPSLKAKMNLAAVIEEIDGTKSYWALAHAPGPPDFHNPDTFTARLPA